MRVAIVHYWLVNFRGGERVIEALLELYPQAELFTLVHDPQRLPPIFRRHTVHESYIGRWPFARRHYQRYLPFMPTALEQFDLRGFDLVISSESGPAKGVIPPADALHLCYCHSPMRYLWNAYHDYKERAGALTRWLMPSLSHRLRIWDVTTAARVDGFIANSANVARRIEAYYRRDAAVLHPPVDTEAYRPNGVAPEDFYLCVGQLVGYKNTELAIEACNRLGRNLVVIGAGEEQRRLEAMAGPTVTLMGSQSAAVLADHYARCRALLFCAEEDFGIVPVEAMAAGRPVIAFGRGGALETVVDGRTGLFFHDATSDALMAAIQAFEAAGPWDATAIRAHAETFAKERFKAGFAALVEAQMPSLR